MSNRHYSPILFTATVAISIWPTQSWAQSMLGSETIDTLRQVDSQGVEHSAAAAAMRSVHQVSSDDLLPLLHAMSGVNPLARNWLRNLAERAAANSTELPQEAMLAFLQDRSNDPFARSLTYELLLDRDEQWREKLLPQCLDDPSRELRWAAVELLLERAKSEDNEANRVAALRRALDASREVEQITRITGSLDKLGHPVDLSALYGFLRDWHVIGPFDNTDQTGFDVAYPPEMHMDPDRSYTGKDGAVTWKSVQTSSEEGIVDLNEEIGKIKGAVAYALTEFHAGDAAPAEVRLGCINANKVWWNGELVMAHEKYHQSMMIDQYRAAVTLRPGENTILVKVCQNEQTEPWAQDWHFQLRITAEDGRAIPSKR